MESAENKPKEVTKQSTIIKLNEKKNDVIGAVGSFDTSVGAFFE